MKNVLIAYSEVPEKFMFLPMNVTDDVYEKLRIFNGQYINNMDSESLQQEMTDFFYESDTGYFKFKDIQTKGPLEGSFASRFDLIIHCGFIL